MEPSTSQEALPRYLRHPDVGWQARGDRVPVERRRPLDRPSIRQLWEYLGMGMRCVMNGMPE